MSRALPRNVRSAAIALEAGLRDDWRPRVHPRYPLSSAFLSSLGIGVVGARSDVAVVGPVSCSG